MIRSQGIIPTCTWATKPSSYIVGQPVFISNAGTKGSHWYYDGTRWKPLNGIATLATQDTLGSNITNTEAVAFQYLVPAGLWQTGDVLRMQADMEKSGVTDTGIIRLRIGTAGTTADTQVFSSGWMGAGNRYYTGFVDFRMDSATSVLQVQTNLGFGGGTSLNTATTISSSSANSLYVSICLVSGGATDTVALRTGMLQLFSKAN